MTATLQRRRVQPHPWWRRHQWESVGLAGLFILVDQCQRCWKVKATNWMIQETFIGDHTMLVKSPSALPSRGQEGRDG